MIKKREDARASMTGFTLFETMAQRVKASLFLPLTILNLVTGVHKVTFAK